MQKALYVFFFSFSCEPVRLRRPNELGVTPQPSYDSLDGESDPDKSSLSEEGEKFEISADLGQASALPIKTEDYLLIGISECQGIGWTACHKHNRICTALP